VNYSVGVKISAGPLMSSYEMQSRGRLKKVIGKRIGVSNEEDGGYNLDRVIVRVLTVRGERLDQRKIYMKPIGTGKRNKTEKL